jgi:hypothetical protein
MLYCSWYRTRTGFEELVEREWVAMGFAFTDRCRHAQGKAGHRAEPSGTVLLFLDAVSQLIRQNPLSFEYSELFLEEVWGDILSCFYPEFVLNNDKERLEKHKLLYNISADPDAEPQLMWNKIRTPSSLLVDPTLNPLYRRATGVLSGASSSTSALRPWLACYYPQVTWLAENGVTEARTYICEAEQKAEALRHRRDGLLAQLQNTPPAPQTQTQTHAAHPIPPATATTTTVSTPHTLPSTNSASSAAAKPTRPPSGAYGFAQGGDDDSNYNPAFEHHHAASPRPGTVYEGFGSPAAEQAPSMTAV